MKIRLIVAIAIAICNITGTAIAADQPLPGQTLCIISAKKQVNGSWAGKAVGTWDVKTPVADDALQMMLYNNNIQDQLLKSYSGFSIFYECMSDEDMAVKRVDPDPK